MPPQTTPEEIAKRFRELFPRSGLSDHISPRIYGSSTNHCDICPKPDSELCQLPCYKERDELRAKDGVTVTVP
jgi:hypothetical protein